MPKPAAKKANPLPFRVPYNPETCQWEMPEGHLNDLSTLYGSEEPQLAAHLMLGLTGSVPGYKADTNPAGLCPNSANSFMAQMQPANPLEAMLLSQMLTIHQHTMRTGKRLTNCEYQGETDRYSRQLNHLARTFTAQVEALHKLRNGNKQTIQVLHQRIQAAPGSQVLVGQKG